MLKIVKVFLPVKDKKFQKRDGEKLRGFFGNFFKEYSEFHHHLEKDKFEHTYSRIQYKIIDDCCCIMGFQESGDLLLNLAENISYFVIGDERYETSPKINITFSKLEISEENFRYLFKTPWFALNQKNFSKYKRGELSLNKLLSNNILEFFKMCNIRAEKQIEVKTYLKKILFRHKNISILGFIGEFETNVNLPDDISLGKRKSIGLGRIKKLEMVRE